MKPDVMEYFEERFGIRKSHFKDFRLYTDQKGRALLGPKHLGPERIVISVGIQIAHSENSARKASRTPSGTDAPARFKPSTNFLQLFGKHATKNTVSLTKEQVQAYLKGEDIPLSGKIDATDGYVILKYQDYPLACGLLRGNRIENVLAKSRRMEIKFL